MPVQNRRMGRQETGDLDVIRKRIELCLLYTSDAADE